MPQLSQIGEIYASQTFWLAIVFLLLYFGVGKAMVPRIERTVDDRAARIAADLAAAEAARGRAGDAQAGYEAGLDGARTQAMRAIAEAQAKATADAEARLKASDAEVEGRLHEATRRIEAGKAAALGEIEAATVEAVQAIVAKLSGAQIDRGAAEAEVRRELRPEPAHG